MRKYLSSTMLVIAAILTGCGDDPSYIPAEERYGQQETGESGNDDKKEEEKEEDSTGETDGDNPDEEGEMTVNGHKCVDLGLSVAWATANIGSNEIPESPGQLFKWGAISAISTIDSPDSYPQIDLDEISGTEHDPATILWGEPWRTPTRREMEELLSSCKTTQSSNFGYDISSPITGNSIYLPTTGFYGIQPDGTFGFNPQGDYYWTATTSTVNTSPAVPTVAATPTAATSAIPTSVAVIFSAVLMPHFESLPRYNACAIRPVCNPK